MIISVVPHVGFVYSLLFKKFPLSLFREDNKKFANYIKKIEKNIHTHVGNVNCMG